MRNIGAMDNGLPIYDAVVAKLGFSLESIAAEMKPAATGTNLSKRQRHKLGQRQSRIMKEAASQ